MVGECKACQGTGKEFTGVEIYGMKEMRDCPYCDGKGNELDMTISNKNEKVDKMNERPTPIDGGFPPSSIIDPRRPSDPNY